MECLHGFVKHPVVGYRERPQSRRVPVLPVVVPVTLLVVMAGSRSRGYRIGKIRRYLLSTTSRRVRDGRGSKNSFTEKWVICMFSIHPPSKSCFFPFFSGKEVFGL
jgi:hypothetical protein